MYRVLIAEDEALVRMGLKTMPDWGKLDMQVAGMLRTAGKPMRCTGSCGRTS